MEEKERKLKQQKKTAEVIEVPENTKPGPIIQGAPPPAINPYALVQMAIEKDFDIQRLEKVLELQKQYEDRQAEKEFEFHFAAMQKEYEPVFKTKFGAEKRYKYCPLDEIQKVYMPIITQHGFSVRWSEKNLPETKEIEITCFLSGYGFTRAAIMILPHADQNKMINPIQARAITISYGKRYTFMSVTGCIVADEDEDGETLKASNAEIRMDAMKMIQYTPKLMQNDLRKELENTFDDQLPGIVEKISGLKISCQDVLKRITDEKKKADAVASLHKVKNMNELKLWKDHIEPL